jgi:hypothetical protein
VAAVFENIITAEGPEVLVKAWVVAIRPRAFVRTHRENSFSKFFFNERTSEENVVIS